MKKRLLILFFPVFLFMCNRAQYSTADLPLNRIYCGQGGGFTGIETTFLLLENGQLFKQYDISQEFIQLESLKKKTAKDFFKRIEKINFFEINMNDPDNMYYFIRCTREGADHRVTWGFPENMQNKELLELYNDILTIAHDRNQNPVK